MCVIGDSCRICVFYKRDRKGHELIIRHGGNQLTLCEIFAATKDAGISINIVVCFNDALRSPKLDYSVYFCHRILLWTGGGLYTS